MMSWSTPFPPPPSNSGQRDHALFRPVAWTSLIVPTLLGLVVGYLAVRFGHEAIDALLEPLRQRFDFDVYTLLALPLAWWLAVLVHELGHVLGGRLAGMRALLLIAGPLAFDIDGDGRWRARRPGQSHMLFGGLAVAVPQASADRRAWMLLAAGGPLASVVLGLVALLPAYVLGGWSGGVLFMLGALSLVIATLTLFPFRSEGLLSDGAQLLDLLRDHPQIRERIRLAVLLAHSHAGSRPREWDPALFAGLDQSADPVVRRFGQMLAAAYAEDRGDLEHADRLWAQVAGSLNDPDAERLAPMLYATIAQAIAIWLAHRRRDVALAQAWYELARGSAAPPVLAAFYETALADARGDPAARRQGIARTRALLPRLPDRGSARVLAEALAEFERADPAAAPPA